MVYNPRMEGSPLAVFWDLADPTGPERSWKDDQRQANGPSAEGSCGHLGHLSGVPVGCLACLKGQEDPERPEKKAALHPRYLC